MVARIEGFIAVRFGYLNLSLPIVAVNSGEKAFICQRVNALFHPWQGVLIP